MGVIEMMVVPMNPSKTHMRNIRGVKSLVDYLTEIGAPMSQSTIYTLLRENKIPHHRPSPRVLIFNLNLIDEWIGGNRNAKN